jgi:hypothetical protein
MKGGGGKRDLRDDGVSEKEATLRNEAVMYVIECPIE